MTPLGRHGIPRSPFRAPRSARRPRCRSRRTAPRSAGPLEGGTRSAEGGIQQSRSAFPLPRSHFDRDAESACGRRSAPPLPAAPCARARAGTASLPPAELGARNAELSGLDDRERNSLPRSHLRVPRAAGHPHHQLADPNPRGAGGDAARATKQSKTGTARSRKLERGTRKSRDLTPGYGAQFRVPRSNFRLRQGPPPRRPAPPRAWCPSHCRRRSAHNCPVAVPDA
jgi:hypothetical protein